MCLWRRKCFTVPSYKTSSIFNMSDVITTNHLIFFCIFWCVLRVISWFSDIYSHVEFRFTVTIRFRVETRLFVHVVILLYTFDVRSIRRWGFCSLRYAAGIYCHLAALLPFTASYTIGNSIFRRQIDFTLRHLVAVQPSCNILILLLQLSDRWWR